MSSWDKLVALANETPMERYLKAQIAERDNELAALRAERDELNETLGAHEDRLQQLRAELAEARKIGIALQRTVTEQSAMLDALSAEASKGADVADALRARVAQLEADPLVRDPQDWHNPDDLARIAELEADATRYRWLTADLNRPERTKRNEILWRMAALSHSAASRDIDAAMQTYASAGGG